MDRLLVEIFLLYKHTWPFAICGIVFNHDAVENPCQDFLSENVFVRHLIISVVRYPHFGALTRARTLSKVLLMLMRVYPERHRSSKCNSGARLPSFGRRTTGCESGKSVFTELNGELEFA